MTMHNFGTTSVFFSQKPMYYYYLFHLRLQMIDSFALQKELSSEIFRRFICLFLCLIPLK